MMVYTENSINDALNLPQRKILVGYKIISMKV